MLQDARSDSIIKPWWHLFETHCDQQYKREFFVLSRACSLSLSLFFNGGTTIHPFGAKGVNLAWEILFSLLLLAFVRVRIRVCIYTLSIEES